MVDSFAFCGQTMVFVMKLWFNCCMLKDEAIDLLGGSAMGAADLMGVTYQAINKWPPALPLRISDRVLGACLRNGIVVPHWFLQPNHAQSPACIAPAAIETAAAPARKDIP